MSAADGDGRGPRYGRLSAGHHAGEWHMRTGGHLSATAGHDSRRRLQVSERRGAGRQGMREEDRLRSAAGAECRRYEMRMSGWLGPAPRKMRRGGETEAGEAEA